MFRQAFRFGIHETKALRTRHMTATSQEHEARAIAYAKRKSIRQSKSRRVIGGASRYFEAVRIHLHGPIVFTARVHPRLHAAKLATSLQASQCTTTSINQPTIRRILGHKEREREARQNSSKQGKSKLPPEFRLWWAMLGGAFAIPISLFWMGWTAYVSRNSDDGDAWSQADLLTSLVSVSRHL